MIREKAMDLQFDPVGIKAGFDAAKSAIDAIKSLRDLYRTKPDAQTDIDAKIALAERELALGEAQLAQALGYQLCKRHFPPVPMLKDRVHSRYVEDIHKCPECGSEEPSPEYFNQKDEFHRGIDRHNERVAREYDWMGN
jgi:hypothetical protein